MEILFDFTSLLMCKLHDHSRPSQGQPDFQHQLLYSLLCSVINTITKGRLRNNEFIWTYGSSRRVHNSGKGQDSKWQARGQETEAKRPHLRLHIQETERASGMKLKTLKASHLGDVLPPLGLYITRVPCPLPHGTTNW